MSNITHQTRNNSVKINAILNVIKTVLSLIFPLITFPYVSRVLGPAGTGKVQFAQSVVTYFVMIASLGVNTYGIREAAKIRDNEKELSKFVKEVFVINIISTIISYILLFLVIMKIPKFYDYRKLLIVCSSSILFTTIGMDWLYSAKEEYFYITIRSLIFQIISLIFLFVFVKNETDYIKYALISVVSNVGSNVCNFIHARKLIFKKLKISLDLKRHFKPIFIFFGMSIAINIYTVLDSTMLGFFCGDKEVGFYNVAIKINKIILALVNSVGVVLLPRLSYSIEKNDSIYFEKLALKGLNFLIFISLPCVIGLTVLAEPVIYLFSGVQYANSIILMKLLNPIILIIGLSNFIGVQIFMPLRMEKLKLYSVIIGCIMNVIFNAILIPKFGGVGAAIGTLVAEGSVTGTQIFFSRKIINWKASLKHILQCCISTIFMYISIFHLVDIIESNVLKIIVSILIACIVYFGCLLLLRNEFFLSFLHLKKLNGNKK